MRFPFCLFLLSLSLSSLPSSPFVSEAGATDPAVYLKDASSAPIGSYSKASYSAATSSPTNNLFYAAESGQEANIRKCIAKGAKIDSQEKGSGETALIKAVIAGKYSSAATLLRLGANPDKKTVDQQHTALMIAARKGRFDFVKLLLDFGADAGTLDSQNRTVVQIAREHNHDDIASYIIERFRKKYDSSSPRLTEVEFTYLMLSDPLFLKAVQEFSNQWFVVKKRIASTDEWRALVASQREWLSSGRNRIGAMIMEREQVSKAMAFTATVKLRYLWLCGQHINSAFMHKNERMYFEGINWHYTDEYIQASPRQYHKMTEDDHNYLLANNAEYARLDQNLGQQWERVKSQIATTEEWRALLESQRAWLKNGRDSVAARLMESENLDRVAAIISATELRYRWLCGEKINDSFIDQNERVYFEGANWHFSNNVFAASQERAQDRESCDESQQSPKRDESNREQQKVQFDQRSPHLTDAEYDYLLSSNPGFASAVHDLDQQWATMKEKIASPEEWTALSASQEAWRTKGRNNLAAKLMTKFNASKETAFTTATRIRYMWLRGQKIREEFMEKEEYLFFAGDKWHYSNKPFQEEQKKLENAILENALHAQAASPQPSPTSNKENLQAEQQREAREKERAAQAASEKATLSLKYNQQLLELASTNKQEEIRKTILMYEADIEYRDPKTGETALMKALLTKQSETVKILVSLGADVNTVSNDKSTPLHIAARQGDLKSVEFLVAKGAKKDALDGNQQTALAIAQKYHHFAVANFLAGKEGSQLEGVKNKEDRFANEVVDF